MTQPAEQHAARRSFLVVMTLADELKNWFTAPACDGFVISATCVPGTYEDFVKFVVPELQRRGLFHEDYAGKNLRENLGLTRPAVGGWRKVGRGG